MEIPSRRQYTIYNYATYGFAAHIPLLGERRYFNNILTGITHPCSVLGDAVTRADNLPFLEIVNIETAVNINIGILEIAGNRVSIRNTAAGNITITTGAGTITLASGLITNLKYNGASWDEDPEITDILHSVLDSIEVIGNLNILDTTYDQKYRIQGAHTITLPTVADNEGIELFFWNEGNHAAVIDGEGAETITFEHGGTALTVTFAARADWIRLKSNGTTWLCTGGYWGYTSGAAVVADAGGAYADGACNYTYWYENGHMHFTAWGFVEVDNTSGSVLMDITIPFTFATANFLQCTYNGAKASDPATLFDTNSITESVMAVARFSDTSSIELNIYKNSGANFVNIRRHLYSLNIIGTT